MPRASEILLDDTIPHGTPSGHKAGCRGSHCPGAESLGMTCDQAAIRYQGDFAYRRRIDAGINPVRIATDDASEGFTPSVDADTRASLVVEPTITAAASQTPVLTIPTGAAIRSAPAPVAKKWAVRRTWVAIAPDGRLLGPFVTQAESMDFVRAQLAPVVAAPVAGGRRPYRRFTGDDEETLRTLHALGHTDYAIAAQMDRSRGLIGEHRDRLGLPANKKVKS